ncbi:MAG: hypothetical protein A3K19_33465 [Lentisphaerae bacterium RIFOXYB12_FULL_65_16]|nr:MAG: hypothetical protein A3K18_05950 [Lentisphaerae bacterium RIFOXYA12_64_32]OGV86939.1 MAG: hypothetical protein A3K19_33465 [Lentisphaerae bacterium RIFOXYB12_FULL_65_16]
MQKILTFSLDDVAFDPAQVAQTLAEACDNRKQKSVVRGFFQIDEVVYAVLHERKPSQPAELYTLVPIEDTSSQSMVSMLEQRWEAGFDALGTVDLGDGTSYLLLARLQDAT